MTITSDVDSRPAAANELTGRMTVEHHDWPLAGWPGKGLAVTRVLFGLVWLVDAYFKWQPGFHVRRCRLRDADRGSSRRR